MEGIRRSLMSQHHFTTAYSPWANGTVQRVCREAIRACRALLSEFCLRQNEWAQVHKLFKAILNNSPVTHHRNLAPITAFTGCPTDTPLRSLISKTTGETSALTDIRLQQLVQIHDVCDSVAAIHEKAITAADIRRSAARVRSATAHATVAPKFAAGDIVLVARREQRMSENLSLRWRGPKRIIGAISDHVYEVQD
jgi:hypothetical protein